jgi:hypothetical protein
MEHLRAVLRSEMRGVMPPLSRTPLWLDGYLSKWIALQFIGVTVLHYSCDLIVTSFKC